MLKNILVILFLTFSVDSFAKEIRVISDTHFYGPAASKKELLTQKFDISLGDIYDIKWTLTGKLDEAIKAQSEFSKNLKKSSILEIDGNHDLKEHPTAYCIKNGVLYTHSFDLSWINDAEYAQNVSERRVDRKGAGKVTRGLFGIPQSFNTHLSEQEKSEAAKLAKRLNCSTIVFGHTHIKELSDTTTDGVRVINVPREITTVDIKENMNSTNQDGCFDINGNRITP